MEPTATDPGHLLGHLLVLDWFVHFPTASKCLTRPGWFPFLFYSTTWVGETYFRFSAPEDVQKSEDTLGDIGRIGSLSLVVFTLISFVGSVLLPWLVRSPDDEIRPFTPRPPRRIASIMTRASKRKPDLVTAWMISHLIF